MVYSGLSVGIKYNGPALEKESSYAWNVEVTDNDGNVLSFSGDKLDTGRMRFPVVDNARIALLWAIKLGLYKDLQQKDVMLSNLVQNIRNESGSIRPEYAENTLSVGFLGVNVILPVLSDSGRIDVAYDLLFQDRIPSWLYSVKNGATTRWERWNSYSIEDSFGDSGMNSFNHYSYGAVMEWMYQYAAGIKPDTGKKGFKHFQLMPHTDSKGRLDYLNTSYDSPYGEIVSNWKSRGGRIYSYTAAVPANTTATLYLPVDTFGEPSTLPATVEYMGTKTSGTERFAVFGMRSGDYNFTISNGEINCTGDLE